MDRSLFLARLMGPTLVAIALRMLIDLGMYEAWMRGSVARRHRVLSVRPAVAARGPRYPSICTDVVRGLARHLTILASLMTIGVTHR